MYFQRALVVVGGLALAGCGIDQDIDQDTDEDVASEQSALGTTTAFYAGSTVTLSANSANNAGWYVNMSNAVWGYRTRLSATITHGGLLLDKNLGLDHLAISIRGASFDGTFQQMGLPNNTGTFLWGETVQQAVAAGT